MSWQAKLVRRAFLLLLVLACVEVTSCVGGRILAARGTFYVAPSTAGFEQNMKDRDPDLGWPSIKRELPGRDAAGSRIVPAFPDTSVKPCVSLYGDSFTFAEEVDEEHAWGNQLALRMGCRVANYGFGGYGTDQAFLRFRREKDDPAKVVILGILTENILRNVNTYRGLIAPNAAFAFKPRFIVGDDGALTLVPMASPTAEEFEKLAAEPEKFLQHEFFVPGGPSGVSRLSFPYIASLVGLRNNFRIRAALRGEPTHAAFYRPDHPSRGLAVTAAIAKQFAKEAKERGAWGGVVIIPLPGDLEYLRDHGKTVHQTLVDELASAGVETLDTPASFLKTLAGKDPCTLYTKCSGGHFNEEGYRLLAEYVDGWLKERAKR